MQEVSTGLSDRISLPAPLDLTENAIHLFFYETEITAEKGGFTMRVEEPAITLTAAIWRDGNYQYGDLEWGVSDPSVIDFRPSENGIQCQVRPLAAAKDGLTLTVSAPADGLTLEIPVYIVG